jgi:predicted PurR-regulated permease PerM
MTYKVDVGTKTFVRFWLVILGLGIVGFLIWQALAGLLIVGASLFFAIALNPIVVKIDKRIPGDNRKLSSAIAYIVVVAVLGVILAVVVPAVVNETVKFVGQMPKVIEGATENWEGINSFGHGIGIDNLYDQIINALKSFSDGFVANFGNAILTSVNAIGGAMAALILILVLTFLMLIEGPTLMAEFWQRVGRDKRAPRAKRVVERMADVVAKYVSGQLTVALIDGFVTAAAVCVLALSFGIPVGLALPFGLITGTFCLIPMFGSFIGGALVAVLLAFNSLWAGVAYIIFFIIYLQIEANVISPKVQSKGLRLPALIVLASVTIGVYMFGLIGAIVAIPIAGCVKVLVEEYARE